MKSVRLLVFILSLIHLSSCKEQVPELRRLGASNESETQNFAFHQSQVSISSPEDALQFQGRCDARFKDLEISFNQGQSWASFSQALGTSGVENCAAQQFQINITRAGDFFTFTSTPEGRTKELWLRGDLGFTKSMIIKSVIRSGDFTPPNPPPVFKTQSMFDTPTLFVSGNTEPDFSHYECRVNQGSWFSCSNNTTITDNGNAIDRGVEAEISVVSVDTSGNRSEVTTTRFKNGIMANGVYGEINDVHVYDNGDILIAGDFETYEPEFTNTLARLHGATGVVDASFIKPEITGGEITSMVGDHINGGVWVNGTTLFYRGSSLSHIAGPRAFYIDQEGDFNASNIFSGAVHYQLEDGDIVSTEGDNLTLRGTNPSSTSMAAPLYLQPQNVRKVREDDHSLFILSGENRSACLSKFDKNDLNGHEVLFCNDFANLGLVPTPYDGEAYPFIFKNSEDPASYNISFQNPLEDFELDRDDENSLIIAGRLNFLKDPLFELDYPSCLFKIPKVSSTTDFSTYQSWGEFVSSKRFSITSPICLSSIHSFASLYLLGSTQVTNNIIVTPSGASEGRLTNFNNRSVHTLKNQSSSLIRFANPSTSQPKNYSLGYYHHADQEFTLFPAQLTQASIKAIANDDQYFYVHTTERNFPTISKKSSHLLLLDDRGNVKKTFQNINGPVTKIIPQGDKVVLIGDFTLFENLARPKLIRLNADYTVDTTVPIINAAFKGGFSDKDQAVYLYGDFMSVSFNGATLIYAHLIKLNPNLTLNTNFRPLFKWGVSNINIIISDAFIDDSDADENNWSIFVTGRFTKVKRSDQDDDQLHDSFRLAKFNAQTGSPDTDFVGQYLWGDHAASTFPIGVKYLNADEIILGRRYPGAYGGKPESPAAVHNAIYIINSNNGNLESSIEISGLDSRNTCTNKFSLSNKILTCGGSSNTRIYQISENGTIDHENPLSFPITPIGGTTHPKGNIFWGSDAFINGLGKFTNKLILLNENHQIQDDLFLDFR